MQFQYNSDYPGLIGPDQTTPAPTAPPVDFPPAQPIPCARITTRVYHPSRQQVATVPNVLVRLGQPRSRRETMHLKDEDDDDMSSSSSSSSEFDDEEMDAEEKVDVGTDDKAYWIQRTIRDAIYGRVALAVVLRRRQLVAETAGAEWEVTQQHCAVKEMSWQHIRRERDRLAEDPIKEVSAMQFIKLWHQRATNTNISEEDGVSESFRAIVETNIMMPLDLLSDDRHLYSIMPYCDGGELFERLDMNERFPEPEARYWMRQILNGLENLQNAGICHRDISLENLLVHQSGALIIDMGMCLRIPYADGLTDAFNNMTMEPTLSHRGRQRCLIRPQGTCGKWIYMSPEIYKNREPFDGYAVDMWAAGVILFLMLTGFPPWERACQTDERFKYMTAGYLVQMLTEWEIGISSDAMDLLQRMLFLDPHDRLSLDQVKAHPWMMNGPCTPPADF